MKRLLATTALIAVAVTGCGSGTKKVALGAPSPTTTTDVPTTGASIPPGLLTGKCQELAQQYSKAATAFSAPSSTAPLSDRFAAVALAIEDAKSHVSNNDVKSALDTLATAYAKLATSLKGVDYKPASGSPPPPAYIAAFQSFSEPKFAAAGKTLSAWVTGGCR